MELGLCLWGRLGSLLRCIGQGYMVGRCEVSQLAGARQFVYYLSVGSDVGVKEH